MPRWVFLLVLLVVLLVVLWADVAFVLWLPKIVLTSVGGMVLALLPIVGLGFLALRLLGEAMSD